MPPVAFRQIPQLQLSNPDAYQPEHIDGECVQQTADVTVLAFVQHDFEPTVAFASTNEPRVDHFEFLARLDPLQ